MELASKARTGSISPWQQHEEEINSNTNLKDSLVLVDHTLMENEAVSTPNNDVQLDLLTNIADEEKASGKAVDESNLDASIGSSATNYILVPSGQDNCFVLEPDYEEPDSSELLSEVNNCIVIEKSPEQQNAEADIDENCSLSPFDVNLSENFIDSYNNISGNSVEDRIVHLEDNITVLSNDKENEDGNITNKMDNKRRRKDDEDDKLFIPTDEETGSSDDEHIILSSNEENKMLDNEQSYSKEVSSKRKRAKRGKANRDVWIANVNKQKRCKGQEYFGRRKNEDGKIVFDVKKPKKTIKARCNCRLTNLRSFACTKIIRYVREKHVHV